MPLDHSFTQRANHNSAIARLVHILEAYEISVILDVGANHGQYAQRVRQNGYQGRIVSFEPLSDIHALLIQNAVADPAWEIAPRAALTDRPGPLTIYRSAESDMSSPLQLRPEMAKLLSRSVITGIEEVPTVRLEDVFHRHTRTDDRPFLKLDTQGYDMTILNDAKECLASLIGIQLELVLVPVYEGEPEWRTVIDRLASFGFTPILFMPGYFNRRIARLISMDGIFVRDLIAFPE